MEFLPTMVGFTVRERKLAGFEPQILRVAADFTTNSGNADPA